MLKLTYPRLKASYRRDKGGALHRQQRFLCSDLSCVIIVMMLILTSTVLRAETPRATSVDDTIWERQGPDVWVRTDDGYRAMAEASEPAYLVSRESYGALHLTVEFWIAPETNSGVFVWCAPGAPISPVACYEANIWDAHPNQQARTGALVGISPPLAKVNTVNRWSRLEIRAETERLRVWVNGELTADITPDRPRHGHLALQYGGMGDVRFRNLHLER